MKKILIRLYLILLIIIIPAFITPQRVFATPECQIFEPPIENFTSYYLVSMRDQNVENSLLFDYAYPTKGDTITCTRIIILNESTIAKNNELGKYLTNTCGETSNGIYLIRTKTSLNNKRLLAYDETCSKGNIKIEKLSNTPELIGLYKSFDYYKYGANIITYILDMYVYIVSVFPANIWLIISLLITIGVIIKLHTRKIFKILLLIPSFIVVNWVVFYLYYYILKLN